jgi:hypothetical protein
MEVLRGFISKLGMLGGRQACAGVAAKQSRNVFEEALQIYNFLTT